MRARVGRSEASHGNQRHRLRAAFVEAIRFFDFLVEFRNPAPIIWLRGGVQNFAGVTICGPGAREGQRLEPHDQA